MGCMCVIQSYINYCDTVSPSNCFSIVLDPRISYNHLVEDYLGDSILSNHLELSKEKLSIYFDEHYVIAEMPTSPEPSSSCTTPLVEGSPQKSFTARYRRKKKVSTSELEVFFNLLAENFDTCNPIHWWVGRHSQFPRLFLLVQDILCILGESFNNCSSVTASAHSTVPII